VAQPVTNTEPSLETTQQEVEEKKYRSISLPIDGLIRSLANRLGGAKAKEVERFIKFAMVGTLGAVVDLGVLNLMQFTLLPPVNDLGERNGFTFLFGIFIPFAVVAATISFIAAITSNFFWNRFWTYPDSRSRSVRRQMVQFATVSTIGWLSRSIWIGVSFFFVGRVVVSIVQMINPAYAPPIEMVGKIGVNVSTLMGIFIVMIWNFFANRYWTYSDVD